MLIVSFNTALQIVNDAAVELGLGEVSDAYGSTDENIVLLRTLLKKTGRRLLREYQWPQLCIDYTFNTVDGTDTYALPPDDFLALVDESIWDQTNDRPLLPASPQKWQWLKAIDSTGDLETFFRIEGENFELHPTPGGVRTIAYRYRSFCWVSTDAGTGYTDLSEPSANTNLVWFDAPMMVAAIRTEWLRAKGFDSTAADDDYKAALRAALAIGDKPAATLSLSGGSGGTHFIDGHNLPDSGWGD